MILKIPKCTFTDTLINFKFICNADDTYFSDTLQQLMLHAICVN